VPAYQKAIVWDYISQEFPEISIYHAHTWLPNDRSLRVFGEFVKSNMLASPEEDVMKFELERQYGDFSFQTKLPDLDNQIYSVKDPLELILDKEESDVVELKTCAFGRITPEQISINIKNLATAFSGIEDCQKIAKTLCAFMNSEGGDLFIGVKEKSSNEECNQVTGIESEMRKVESGGYPRTKDGYERLIRDGIIKVFIPEYNYATKSIEKIDFLDYEGHIICWIKVKPSKKPVFMIDYRRNGEPIFYIRSGRESNPLEIKGASEYILTHFCPKM